MYQSNLYGIEMVILHVPDNVCQGINRTFMELKFVTLTLRLSAMTVSIEPLWNGNLYEIISIHDPPISLVFTPKINKNVLHDDS